MVSPIYSRIPLRVPFVLSQVALSEILLGDLSEKFPLGLLYEFLLMLFKSVSSRFLQELLLDSLWDSLRFFLNSRKIPRIVSEISSKLSSNIPPAIPLTKI